VAISVRSAGMRKWWPFRLRIGMGSDYTSVPLSLYSLLTGSYRQPMTNLSSLGSTGTRVDSTLLVQMLKADGSMPNMRLALINDDSLSNQRWQLDMGASLPPYDQERPSYERAEQAASECYAPTTETLTLGRVDTLAHFEYGRDLLTDQSSLSWHVLQQPAERTVNNYLGFAVVVLAGTILQQLVTYESAFSYISIRQVLLGSRGAALPPPQNTSKFLLSVRNTAFRSWMCQLTLATALLVSFSLLTGMQVDRLSPTDLLPEQDVSAVIYCCAAVSVLLALGGPELVRRYPMWLVPAHNNALTLSVWLMFAADGQMFFSQLVMLACAAMVYVRDLEFVMLVASGRLLPVQSYRRMLWPLLVVGLARLGFSTFLLHGYTMPVLLDVQWPGQGFSPLFHIVSALAVFLLASRTVIGQLYLVADYRVKLRNAELSKRQIIVTDQGRAYLIPSGAAVKL